SRERFEESAAEIQRAQLRERQPRRHRPKRLAVDRPARAPIVLRSIVEERKAGFLERLQIASNGAGRHAAQRRQFVNRHADARALDLAQDRPLADDFRIPTRHGEAVAYWQRRRGQSSIRAGHGPRSRPACCAAGIPAKRCVTCWNAGAAGGGLSRIRAFFSTTTPPGAHCAAWSSAGKFTT